jgi:RNA polymerase sigma factor (TIGR02999 family)
MTNEYLAQRDIASRTGAGDTGKLEKVFAKVYDELRRLAHHQLKREPQGLTLATTDLVHEAYIRLSGQHEAQWQSRSHFMAIAATAMRWILVDHARAHRSQKRGGTLARVSLDAVDLPVEKRADFLVALDEALDRLRHLDARQAQIVECRSCPRVPRRWPGAHRAASAAARESCPARPTPPRRA